MSTLLQDLRYAVRRLAKSRRFTAVAVLTLALGIGANSAVFSVVNAVLLRPLPYPDPDRIVTLWQTSAGDTRDRVSGPNYLDWQQESRSFDSMAAVIGDDPTLTGRGEPVRLDVSQVSAGYFPTMGVAPVLGRGLLPADDRRGTERVVVVSHGLWRERLGGKDAALGETLLLDERPHTVVGVMPAGYGFPRAADAWVPLAMDRANAPSRGDNILRVLGRLRVGVPPQAAQAEMEGIARRLAQEHPQSNSGSGVSVVPLRELLVGDVRSGVLSLLGAVGCVLLIACVNVASLLLAQSTRRRSEIALRVALGAGRLRIVRQLVTESLMIALLGAASGLAAAWVALRVLVGMMPSELPHVGEIEIDGRVLVFTLVVALTSGVLFGLVPALQTTRDLRQPLGAGSRGTAGSRGRLGAILVVAEVALAFVLLIGAGLFIRSLSSLRGVDPGFDPRQVLTANVDLPRSRFPDARRRAGLYRELVDRIEATPGVRSVGLTTTLPLTDSDLEIGIRIPGHPALVPGEGPSAGFNAVTEGYFRTMHIALRAGRELTRADDEHGAPVIIVSESLARRHWPGESPIGKRMTVEGVLGWPDIEREIVGVVSDVHHDGLNAAARSEMYVPYAQMPWSFASIVVRSAEDPRAVAAGVRTALAAVDRSQAASGFRSMETIVATSIAQWRFQSSLLGVFGAIALALTCVGLHGVVGQAVAQRMREIGVRMALGATSRDVAAAFVRSSLLLAAAGIAIGVPMALASTRMIRSSLFGIEPEDPITMAGAALLLLAVALLSAWLPVRRAARVDPMVALRCE